MRALTTFAVAASFAVSFAAIAETTETTSTPAPQPTPTQLEGRAFGEHVSGVAPEHAILHGALFGECVSEMAITGDCPHEEMDE